MTVYRLNALINIFLILIGLKSEIISGSPRLVGLQNHRTEDSSYILHYRLNVKNLPRKHNQKQDLICDWLRDYDVTCIKRFSIGRHGMLQIRANKTQLEKISSYDAIDTIQVNNRHVLRQLPQNVSSVCLSQETGSELWGLSRIASRKRPSYQLGKYNYYPKDGSGVTAYIIDSGIDVTHPEFEGRAKIGFSSQSLALEGDLDLNGHGTHVAGIIGGATYGAAKKVAMVAVKVFGADGTGSTVDVLAGLEWIFKHVSGGKNILNLSLGGRPGQVDELLEETLSDLVNELSVPVIVAAGNDKVDACEVSPARISDALTVGATDSSDVLALFSNYGKCVDILAPGVNILSSFPDDMAAILSGTSMAAPYVTGVVARYLSESTHSPSPDEIKRWLQTNAGENFVQLPTISNTKNLLLHMNCYGAEISSADWTSNSLILLGLSMIGALCFVAIATATIAACNRRRKTTRSRTDYEKI